MRWKPSKEQWDITDMKLTPRRVLWMVLIPIVLFLLIVALTNG